MLTDVRLLSPRLAEASAGPDARVVPLHLADTALLDSSDPATWWTCWPSIRRGATSRTAPRVVARGAVVVLTSTTKAPGGGEGVVLVALPAQEAVEAAGASLSQAVTLTFH